MKQTPNYKLNMPEGNDFVDIENLNENARILESTLTSMASSIAGKQPAGSYASPTEVKKAQSTADTAKATASTALNKANANASNISDLESEKFNKIGGAINGDVTANGNITMAVNKKIKFTDGNGIGASLGMSGENFVLIEDEDSNKEWLKFNDDDGLYVLGEKVWHKGSFNPDTKANVAKTSVKTLNAGWYRIAQNNGNRSFGRFLLKEARSSSHQALEFIAGIHYGAGPIINVLGNSAFSSNGAFRYLRIVRKSTYDPVYLEVYVDIDATTGVQAAMYDNLQSDGWQIVDLTAGGIPSGYTAHQIDLDQARGFNTTEEINAVKGFKHNGESLDNRYLKKTAKAVDSDKLDGLNSTDFSRSTHNHDTAYLKKTAKAADSDKLDGLNSTDFSRSTHNHDTAYLKKTAKAADSDKLDGLNSTSFARSTHNHDSVYLKKTAKAANSDKLDGYNSTDFARSSHTHYHLAVQDSRSANTPPKDYDNMLKAEFKYRSKIGAPGSQTYGGLLTFAPWSETSGGYGTQLFASKDGLYHRVGDLSASSWNSWNTIWHSGNFNPAAKATKTEVQAAHSRANAAYKKADQAFQSVSSGKIKLGAALADKGINVPSNSSLPNQSFDWFAQSIRSISTGKTFAEGTVNDTYTVSNLSFKPSTIIAKITDYKDIIINPCDGGCQHITESCQELVENCRTTTQLCRTNTQICGTNTQICQRTLEICEVDRQRCDVSVESCDTIQRSVLFSSKDEESLKTSAETLIREKITLPEKSVLPSLNTTVSTETAVFYSSKISTSSVFFINLKTNAVSVKSISSTTGISINQGNFTLGIKTSKTDNKINYIAYE